MLSLSRLKGKYKAVLLAEATNNQLNPADHAPILAAIDRIAEGFAKATIEEIKESKVMYSAGLTSATGGPVTGVLNHTIQ